MKLRSISCKMRYRAPMQVVGIIVKNWKLYHRVKWPHPDPNQSSSQGSLRSTWDFQQKPIVVSNVFPYGENDGAVRFARFRPPIRTIFYGASKALLMQLKVLFEAKYFIRKFIVRGEIRRNFYCSRRNPQLMQRFSFSSKKKRLNGPTTK